MRRNPLRLLAFTGAVALGFATTNHVVAQDTVEATLTTSSAITTVDVSDMAFGTWLIQIGNGTDTGTLTMNDSGAYSVVAAGTMTTTPSQTILITAGVTRGEVTVDTPSPSVLQMTRSALVDFIDPALSLTSVTYNTDTEGAPLLLVPLPVTVTTGAGTPETVRFGSVITVAAGLTPADATHTASFTVSFAY